MLPGRDLPWDTRVKDERGQSVFIRLSEAASYINEKFCTALEVFYLTENMGCLPFSGGWAEQPEWITLALSTLKAERWKIDEEERELKQIGEEARRKHVK